MSVKAGIIVVSVVTIAGVMVAVLIPHFMLATRIGRLKKHGELPGYRLRMFKYLPPLGVTWGFTSGELDELIEIIRGDDRYREELKLAYRLKSVRIMVGVIAVVLGLVLMLLWSR